MKKNTILVAALLAMSSTMAACGAATISEEDRIAAHETYRCGAQSRVDAGFAASQLGMDALGGKIPANQSLEAANAAAELNRARTVGEVVDPDGDGVCEGWYWDYFKTTDEYAESEAQFTDEQAAEVLGR